MRMHVLLYHSSTLLTLTYSSFPDDGVCIDVKTSEFNINIDLSRLAKVLMSESQSSSSHTGLYKIISVYSKDRYYTIGSKVLVHVHQLLSSACPVGYIMRCWSLRD